LALSLWLRRLEGVRVSGAKLCRHAMSPALGVGLFQCTILDGGVPWMVYRYGQRAIGFPQLTQSRTIQYINT